MRPSSSRLACFSAFIELVFKPLLYSSPYSTFSFHTFPTYPFPFKFPFDKDLRSIVCHGCYQWRSILHGSTFSVVMQPYEGLWTLSRVRATLSRPLYYTPFLGINTP